MSQVELIIMQYAFKFDFNSRCQWGVAGALGAPDRKCRKPYIVGCFSNWKFIGSSKLLIENEPNEVPPPLVRQVPFGPICSIYRIVS